MSSQIHEFGSEDGGKPQHSEKEPHYTAVPLSDLERTLSPGTGERKANRKLDLFEATRHFDPNISNEALSAVRQASVTHNAKEEIALANELVENSPYPEVRAVVRNYDEDLPANTIRAWFIGMLLTTIGSGLNMLFSTRAPAISISGYVAQLVAYPIGRLMQATLPDKEYHSVGLVWNLNPGKFNVKEHALIVVMANASFSGGAGYFTDVLIALRSFYGLNFGWGFNVMVALATQLTGFGIAGLLRTHLVEAASMIWPSTLVSVAFLYALHEHEDKDKGKDPATPTKTASWTISRYRWFFYIFGAAFIWYWIPGLMFQALSAIAFVTWIKPNNVIVNQLFGASTGVSLIPLTLDWTQVTGYISSPLISPWHAIGNTLIGTVFFFWIIAISVHYSGIWWGPWLPISDSGAYDNTQNRYNVSRIITPEFRLNITEYKAYSPLFLSTTFSLSYGLSFASISAVMVHTAIFHGQEIWIRLRAARGELDDIHTKMMKKYPVVPGWWYGSLFVVTLAMSFAIIYTWPTSFPWWGLVVAFLIPLLWTLPIGMILAVSNIALGLNVFTEFMVGYLLPGRPIAMMLFKTFGYITMYQALSFVSDLKFGHYVKVPQRTMFWGQIVATIWSCFVQLIVMEWSLSHIEDICTPAQKNHFTCPGQRVFFNASIIWGLIGPQRIFSPGAVYAQLQWFWLAGAALPVIIYAGARMFPRSNIRFLSAPVIFGGTGQIPPATPLNYLSWGIVGFVFQKVVRNRHREWWMKYNYVTSAALDVGLALSTIVIIAALNLTNTTFPNWWGNGAPLRTLDMNGTAIQKVLEKGETFGPPAGSW